MTAARASSSLTIRRQHSPPRHPPNSTRHLGVIGPGQSCRSTRRSLISVDPSVSEERGGIGPEKSLFSHAILTPPGVSTEGGIARLRVSGAGRVNNDRMRAPEFGMARKRGRQGRADVATVGAAAMGPPWWHGPASGPLHASGALPRRPSPDLRRDPRAPTGDAPRPSDPAEGRLGMPTQV